MWYKYWFEGAKVHVVPSELSGEILADLLARGAEFEHEESVNSVTLDKGGPCLADRNWVCLDFKDSDFSIKMPAVDYEFFLSKFKTAQLRIGKGNKNYYKLHADGVCVVFTPGQKEEIIEVMEEEWDNVKIMAEEDAKRYMQAFTHLKKNGIVQ